ncbi:MAG: TonB family protein [Bacteroidales bacterium]|nr:TonB family protein [Bacteroidales bacterium]
MNNLLLYFLKVSAGTTMLYLCYLLFFSKDTFYLRNRILLIMMLILPAFFPVIKIPVSVNIPTVSETVIPSDSFFLSDSGLGTTLSASVNSFDYNRLFTLIYFTIAGVLFIRIIISLISTYKIIRGARIENNQFPKIVISDNHVPPFSFFPYAVIPSEDYKTGNYKDLLDHEFAHIRQGHTFDLLLCEFFIAFQWFNPFIWLIRRSIVLNHEYLADKVTLINMKGVKEYQYRLLNFQSGFKNISLAHSFNSLIKSRIIMINKNPTRKYAMMKTFIILPIMAFLVYAFATPEYKSVETEMEPLIIYQSAGIIQKEVKGIVLKDDGSPLPGVYIMNTGTEGNAFIATTGNDGRFSIMKVPADASLIFTCRGYKSRTLKPDFNIEMSVKMEKDSETRIAMEEVKSAPAFSQGPERPVVIDGKISDKNITDAIKDLGYNMGISKMISGKEATDKYGEKGANGVYEIISRVKALEMGLKPPFPRLSPDDYPTFQNQHANTFSEWVTAHAIYPEEAKEKKIEGWVSVSFRIELDGTVSNVFPNAGIVDPILMNEIIRVVQSSPKWDSPKNKNVDEPYSKGLQLHFKLPDQILNESPFIVAEQMPKYPGGDAELLNFIKNNTKYPETAKAERIEGRAIIRFIVNPEGNVEGLSILKGAHPLLDAEAVRVVSTIRGFKPGMQGGKPVYVWYMVPVNFSLDNVLVGSNQSSSEKLFLNTSEVEILKFLGMNTGYPQEAKSASDTGRVYVVVKLKKGGIDKECKAFTEKTGIKAPFLPEVVIVGYKSSSPGPNEIRPGFSPVKSTGNGLIALQQESVRVANMLSVNEIPDWLDKDMEFVITLIYTLK